MSRLSNLNIPTPCPQDWSAMAGDERRRFCSVCEKDVHNLSACTRDEAEALLASNPTLCVRVLLDAAGRTLHRAPTFARLGASLAAAIGAGVLMQACSDAAADDRTPRMGKPVAHPVLADGGTPQPHPMMGEVAAPAAPDGGTVVPPSKAPQVLMGAPVAKPPPPPPPKSTSKK